MRFQLDGEGAALSVVVELHPWEKAQKPGETSVGKTTTNSLVPSQKGALKKILCGSCGAWSTCFYHPLVKAPVCRWKF